MGLGVGGRLRADGMVVWAAGAEDRGEGRVHRFTLRTSEGSGGIEPLFCVFPNRLRFRMVKQRPKPDSSSPDSPD